MDWDILIEVLFISTEAGGRAGETPPTYFWCLMEVGDVKYDCRLLLDKIGPIKSGATHNKVPVKFLDIDLVRPLLKSGMQFQLFDGKAIASGIIESIR